MEPQRFIVAEISKNWPEQHDERGMRRLLAERFEDVIDTNHERGYRLVDWKLDRFHWEQDGETHLNETIVAVFELQPS